MIIFKNTTDLAKLPADNPARAVIQSILSDFPRDPDIHGYTVLIEPGDTDINQPELKAPIADLCWDGVTKQEGHYHAVYLTNNEFSLEFIIPDADWLDADLRASLEEQAQKPPPYMKDSPF